VAEVFVQFVDPVLDEDGRAYTARACGAEMPDGRWQGWVEFVPADGEEPIRSRRETTQPNRTDAQYWATGLTPVYLEGALRRALNPVRLSPAPIIAPPIFDGPAAPVATDEDLPPVPSESILNPFSVYRKGETLLRSQLAALSKRHLVNITQAHDLSDLDPDALSQMPPSALVEIIVAGVRGQLTPE